MDKPYTVEVTPPSKKELEQRAAADAKVAAEDTFAQAGRARSRLEILSGESICKTEDLQLAMKEIADSSRLEYRSVSTGEVLMTMALQVFVIVEYSPNNHWYNIKCPRLFGYLHTVKSLDEVVAYIRSVL